MIILHGYENSRRRDPLGYVRPTRRIQQSISRQEPRSRPCCSSLSLKPRWNTGLKTQTVYGTVCKMKSSRWHVSTLPCSRMRICRCASLAYYHTVIRQSDMFKYNGYTSTGSGRGRVAPGVDQRRGVPPSCCRYHTFAATNCDWMEASQQKIDK